MSKIERLARKFADHLAVGWPAGSSGAQRVVMLIYEPADERVLRRKLPLFEQAAIHANRTWRTVDVTSCIAEWLARHRYKETYFQEPEELCPYDDRLTSATANKILAALTDPSHDENEMLAIVGAGSLFALVSLADVLGRVSHAIKGRLIVFFPGRHHEGRYRLLDARESWDYLAVPIAADEAGVAS
jgi:hypothetical protein